MCSAWPCCERGKYTVRRYEPDGRTAWVRNFGYPIDSNAVPVDCAVGSDGRVFVLGPRVANDGMGAWSIRCYSAAGDTLWFLDLVDFFPAIPNDALVLMREIERDAADNVYCIANCASENASLLLIASKDGEVLDIDQGIFGAPTTSGRARIGVAPDGHYKTIPFNIQNVAQQVVNDIALTGPVSGDVEVIAAANYGLIPFGGPGEPGGAAPNDAFYPVNRNPGGQRRTWIEAPNLEDTESCSRVCIDVAGRATFTGGPWTFRNPVFSIAQYSPSLDINWFSPGAFSGPVACAYDGRLVALMNGEYGGPALSRFPSICRLSVEGGLIWAHYHGDALDCDIGEGGTVASVCHPREFGKQEWDYLASLVGS